MALVALKRTPHEQLECFSRCVELAPEIPNAWYEKGATLHDLGRVEEALECYDRALNLNPDFGDALKGKTIALRELGCAEEALEYHDQLIRVDPTDATAWNDKGRDTVRCRAVGSSISVL